MFNIRDEGEIIKQGFNIYPIKSNNIGFVFRFNNRFISFRYSKIIKKFRFCIQNMPL